MPADSGAAVTVIGFGLNATGGRVSFTLQETVNLKTVADCSNRFNDNVICAGGSGSLSQGCFGDSGGPLMVRGSAGDTPVLVGIVSYGGSRCEDSPGGFTRLSSFDSFLKAAVCDFSSVPPDDCPPAGLCPSIYKCGGDGLLSNLFSNFVVHRTGLFGGCISSCVMFAELLVNTLGWECGPC